jgi:hypothetical protein
MKLLLTLACAVLAFSAGAQTTARLIPFQGRLTDQNNVPYTTGQYTIIFALYDQPVGGSLLWSERHEKVGVINGMVNVFLGSIRSFDAPGGTNVPVTFSTTRYLGITIDVDGNANTPDPEMIPRQMIIPAFWAKTADNATQLAGYDWTPIFGVNNPTVPLPGSKIGAGTIPAAQLVPNSITAGQVAPAAITGSLIATGTITATNIAPGAISFSQTTGRTIATNTGPAGSLVISSLIPGGFLGTSVAQQAVNNTTVPVTNATVTLATTGRPVVISFIADFNLAQGGTLVVDGRNTSGAAVYYYLTRNGVQVTSEMTVTGGPNVQQILPISTLSFMDFPPASSGAGWIYQLHVRIASGSNISVNGRMVAYEF